MFAMRCPRVNECQYWARDYDLREDERGYLQRVYREWTQERVFAVIAEAIRDKCMGCPGPPPPKRVVMVLYHGEQVRYRRPKGHPDVKEWRRLIRKRAGNTLYHIEKELEEAPVQS